MIDSNKKYFATLWLKLRLLEFLFKNDYFYFCLVKFLLILYIYIPWVDFIYFILSKLCTRNKLTLYTLQLSRKRANNSKAASALSAKTSQLHSVNLLIGAFTLFLYMYIFTHHPHGLPILLFPLLMYTNFQVQKEIKIYRAETHA